MKKIPKLKKIIPLCKGNYLNEYRMVYETPDGGTKDYEMVSRRTLTNAEDVGSQDSGVSVVVFCEDKLLLLREYRMAVNGYVMNLVGGMIESGETIEDCVKREVFEETGLVVTKIREILPSSYAAVAISDVRTNLVIAEADGTLKKWDEKENIYPGLYTPEQVGELIRTEKFADRCQLIAHYYAKKQI